MVETNRDFLLQVHYLDQIDLKPYIKKYEDLRDLKYALEDDYDNTEFTQNDVLEGNILNYFDLQDLSWYISSRYNISYQETIAYIRYNELKES